LNEAFRDHWGHSESTEEDYQRWIHSPDFQPQLWQVAWAGDEVAGMVLNYIDRGYNEEFKRRRGWTDPICVRRPWRKQGLAKALIVRSMRLLQEQGMTEAGLGVDAQNPNGALRLYESLGFRAVQQFTTLEKPMD
jgi:ribosomal protein S18 acetylase RimI-like enzyme